MEDEIEPVEVAPRHEPPIAATEPMSKPTRSREPRKPSRPEPPREESPQEITVFGGVHPSDAGIGENAHDPMAAAAEFLQMNGFLEGWDPESQTLTVVASAGLPCGPDNPAAFADCRNAAFQLAMLDAKKQIAEFLAAEIESTVKSLYIEPSAPPELQTVADEQEYEARFRAASSAAEKAILEMGGGAVVELLRNTLESPGDYAAISSTETFRSAVKVVARQQVAAVQCVRSFESISGDKGGRIAVVAILSPKSVAIAKSLLGEGPRILTTERASLAGWVAGLEQESQLLYTHGVIQRTNENGELCLIAFGHASPRTPNERSMDAAYQKARLNAMQALRQYAGELIASSADQSTGYDLTTFADNTQEFENDLSFTAAIDAVAKKLTLPGVSQLARTKLMHPQSEQIPTAIVAVQWSVSSSDAASELRSTLDAMRGSGRASKSADGT